MNWLKKLFGNDEEEQAATESLPAKKMPPAPSPSFGEDDVIPRSADGKKVKLNFKKIPKKVLDAMAAETTGQPRTIVMQEQPDTQFGGSGLSGAFNNAASPAPKMMKPKMMAPKP